MPNWRELFTIAPGAGRLDPGKMSLGALLAGINVLLVILVIGGISWVAVDLLRDLADDQGMARVQVGAIVGPRGHPGTDRRDPAGDPGARRAADPATTLAGTAGPLPAGLPEADLPPAVSTGCALTAPGSEPLLAGRALPWEDIFAATDEQGDRLLVAPAGPGDPLVGGVATVPAGSSDAPAARLVLIRALDAETATRLSKRAGMAVRLLNYNTFADEGADNRRALFAG